MNKLLIKEQNLKLNKRLDSIIFKHLVEIILWVRISQLEECQLEVLMLRFLKKKDKTLVF